MIQVGFDRELHKYVNLLTGEPLISATTLIHHHYTPPFDGAFWSFYKAVERVLGVDQFKAYKRVLNANKSEYFIKNYFQFHDQIESFYKVQELILAEWKKKNEDACEKGTNFHDAQEAAAINAKRVLKEGLDLEVFPFEMHLDLENLPIGYYPELRLYNLDYGVAGTSDCIWILPGKQVIIEDFKTNKELKFENKFQTMLHPLTHLSDCNFNHYQMQLSLYGYMLECYGYSVKDIAIIYQEERIPVQYLREEVIAMLTHYQNSKNEIINHYDVEDDQI